MEEDLEQIQHNMEVAHQKLEEDTSVKLEVARVHNEKKHQDQEDQKWKEEEDQKKKDEEDKKAKETAHNAWKRQLVVSTSFILCSQVLTVFQMLQKQKEACKVWWVDIDGVSARKYFQSL